MVQVLLIQPLEIFAVVLMVTGVVILAVTLYALIGPALPRLPRPVVDAELARLKARWVRTASARLDAVDLVEVLWWAARAQRIDRGRRTDRGQRTDRARSGRTPARFNRSVPALPAAAGAANAPGAVLSGVDPGDGRVVGPPVPVQGQGSPAEVRGR